MSSGRQGVSAADPMPGPEGAVPLRGGAASGGRSEPQRERSGYVCQACGYESARWLGRCPGCGAWGTLESTVGAVQAEVAVATPVAQVPEGSQQRLCSGIAEFDRVLGGGIVPGALVLLGGDPGVGKSTLLLQLAAAVARGVRVLYVSGEESAAQIKGRARRLGAMPEGLWVAAAWDVGEIERLCGQHEPGLLIVDSVQTMRAADCPLAPGSPVQLREVTAALTALARSRHLPTLMIGHVTKAGLLAGPRLLEHMVDVVLLFEGERFSPFRLLRSLKNRFGSTQELGVFQMAEGGLREVANPSELLLAERARGVSGSVVTVTLEGSRPLLCEVQALLAGPAFGTPRRTAHGIDAARLALLLAVLERRCGLRCNTLDAYVKVAGGVRLEEPAADLACALALASAYRDRSVPPEVAVCGEIGLGGEVRGVARLEDRVAEAGRLGFRRLVVPVAGSLRHPPGSLELRRVSTLAAALDAALSAGDGTAP